MFKHLKLLSLKTGSRKIQSRIDLQSVAFDLPSIYDALYELWTIVLNSLNKLI